METVMIRRILKEKNFLACLLAAISGIVLYFRYPFPEQNFFLELIFLWARPVIQGLKYSSTVFLYTTPYIIYSFLLSGLYIFTLKSPPHPKAGKPPVYPITSNRNHLFLVLGEVHNPRTPEPSETPYWLTIPERGLFTGIAVFGAVGSGKTSAALYPYAEQILPYEAANPEKRIGGGGFDTRTETGSAVESPAIPRTGKKPTGNCKNGLKPKTVTFWRIFKKESDGRQGLRVLWSSD